MKYDKFSANEGKMQCLRLNLISSLLSSRHTKQFDTNIKVSDSHSQENITTFTVE
jgi:hypothetical protein